MAICQKVITQIGIGRDYGHVAITECDFYRPMIVNCKEALMTDKQRRLKQKMELEERRRQHEVSEARVVANTTAAMDDPSTGRQGRVGFSGAVLGGGGGTTMDMNGNANALSSPAAISQPLFDAARNDAVAASKGVEDGGCERGRVDDDTDEKELSDDADDGEDEDDGEPEEFDFVAQLEAEIRFDAMLTRISNGTVLNFDFVFFICIASAVSGLGLASDNAAVLAGALVSPMMGPILATVMETVLKIQSSRTTMVGEESGRICGRRLLLTGFKVEFLCLGVALVIGFIIGLCFWHTDVKYFNCWIERRDIFSDGDGTDDEDAANPTTAIPLASPSTDRRYNGSR